MRLIEPDVGQISYTFSLHGNLVHDSSGHHDDDPVDIAWTSSENEGSGNESPKQSLAKAVPPKRQERKRKIQRPAGRASHALPAGEGTDAE